MRKEEFLKQLEYLLQDIPDADKDEAMAYYRDYLEEAGTENEDQVIEEFGSPERVAAIIRADVTGNLKEGGSFTENGYEDERFRDPNFQVVKRLDLPDEKEQETSGNTSYGGQQDFFYNNTGYHDAEYRECYSEEKEEDPVYTETKKKRWTSKWLKRILWAALLVAASPFILMAGGIVLGAVGGVLGIGIGVAVMILALTAGVLIASVCLAAFGIAFLATTPLDSLFLFGFAVLGIGCGLLGAVCCYLIFGVFAPFIVKSCGKLVKFLSGLGKERKTA